MPHNSFLEVAPEAPSSFRDNPLHNKTRTYLDKGLQELTYLLIPPAHPPPPPESQMLNQEMAAVHGYVKPPQTHLMNNDMYLQQQRYKNHQQHDMGLSHISPSQNHQSLPIPSSELSNYPHATNQAQHPQHMSRHLADQQPLPQGRPLSLVGEPPRTRLQPSISFPTPSDQPTDKPIPSYDSFGRPISAGHEESNAVSRSTSDDRPKIDPDAWNFDEPLPSTSEDSNLKPPRLDTDRFPHPNTNPSQSPRSPPRTGLASQRRKGSMSRRRSDESPGTKELSSPSQTHIRAESPNFKVRFALRGHLDVVRAVIFTGGGSPSEPEICTTGDDGVLKRWIIPASYGSFGPQGVGSNDLDVTSYFTHRGHTGAVTSLAAYPTSQNFSTGGRAVGDGWVFSGGQDATVRVWERGRVDPKATLDGHTDAVWSVCVLPASSVAVFGGDSNNFGGPDRMLLASGAADGTIKIWAVSAPPQLSSPRSGSRRGIGGSRRHSVTSGSGFPSSPQPSTATAAPFHHTLVHTITRPDVTASPTCIAPLSVTGESFVASYNDASILIFDTRTGEEVVGMASLETYDGSPGTGVNSVVATTVGLANSISLDSTQGLSEDDGLVHGATGSSGGVEGVVISGHEDRYIRFFDANSGKQIYPAAVAFSLSPPLLSLPQNQFH